MAYKTNSLNMKDQPIAGRRGWVYDDTGMTLAELVASGAFADAKDKGVKVGDPIDIVSPTGGDWHPGHFSVVQDTGGTTGTVVLDTD